MTIDELLQSTSRFELGSMPEADALTELDALQEADLADVQVDAEHGVVALLFDLRSALQFRMANTAVLVLRGATDFEWAHGQQHPHHREAHYVMSSSTAVDGNRLAIEVVCLRGWRVRANCQAAEFFVGDIPGLSEAPPNFVEDTPATIEAGMPSWSSPFEAHWATFIHPRPMSDGFDG